MTYIHFILEAKVIQNFIEKSIQNDISKNILQTAPNQLIGNQQTECIQANEAVKGHSCFKSTNMLKFLNQDVIWREKIIHIFPNTDSSNRLIGIVLIEIHDEWMSSSNTYIKL